MTPWWMMGYLPVLSIPTPPSSIQPQPPPYSHPSPDTRTSSCPQSPQNIARNGEEFSPPNNFRMINWHSNWSRHITWYWNLSGLLFWCKSNLFSHIKDLIYTMHQSPDREILLSVGITYVPAVSLHKIMNVFLLEPRWKTSTMSFLTFIWPLYSHLIAHVICFLK